ncbi:hypothetical protein T06_2289 [Trichinella sp. T6]|nr:hypothetical protein T06_2289 [Trichinella sp. T6]
MAPVIPTGQRQTPLPSAGLSSCQRPQPPPFLVDVRSARPLPSVKGSPVSCRGDLRHWTPDLLKGLLSQHPANC